jgi:hypothetical protein
MDNKPRPSVSCLRATVSRQSSQTVTQVLMLFENLLLRYKMSEYHTEYRAFSRAVWDALPLEANSNDLVR